MKEKINLSEIVGDNQTKFLKEAATYLDRKLEAHLYANRGNGKATFEIGMECFDIVTYVTATPCKITDKWIENGWPKYRVEYATIPNKLCVSPKTAILREKDLVRR